MAFHKTKLQEKENSYNREDLSAAEIYAIHMKSSEPKFYHLSPGILPHLTYVVKTKKGTQRKKLSALAERLYSYYRQIAGSSGNLIFQTPERTCKVIGCKIAKFYQLIKELTQKFEQLNGKSLIIKVPARKVSTTEAGEKRVQNYSKYDIEDIWPENNAYMATLKYHEEMEIGEILSDFEQDLGEETSILPACNRSDIDSTSVESIPPDLFHQSRIDPLGDYESANNNPSFTKKKSVKEQQPADACDCNSQNEDPVTGFALAKEKAEKAMRAVGCDENLITELLKKYTPQQINQAGYYVQQQLKRKPIANRLGYFRRAVEKGWKWKEPSKAKKKTS